MEVFVIPLARERYELYCEVASEPDPEGDASPRSLVGRWRQRLADMLKNAEARYHHRRAGIAEEPKGWLGRQQDRMMTWVVERIAEQRLLWNLRGQTAAVLMHPEDMSGEEATTLVRARLQRDYERHRLWLIIDTIGMVLSWPLVFVPGPNVLLYYFMLRVGGHWFSMRGAKQGIHHVTWTPLPCEALTELREIIGMEPVARKQRVLAIATRLRLQHFTAFFERVAAVPVS